MLSLKDIHIRVIVNIKYWWELKSKWRITDIDSEYLDWKTNQRIIFYIFLIFGFDWLIIRFLNLKNYWWAHEFK